MDDFSLRAKSPCLNGTARCGPVCVRHAQADPHAGVVWQPGLAFTGQSRRADWHPACSVRFLRLHVQAENGIDLGLVALALSLEPVEHIGVET